MAGSLSRRRLCGKPRQRISRFELVRREVLAMLLASVALLAVVGFRSCPTGSAHRRRFIPAGGNPCPLVLPVGPGNAQAGQPIPLGVVVPLALLTLLMLIPYIFPKPALSEIGRWFPKSNRLAQIVFMIILLTIMILTVLALLPIS